MSKTNKDKFRQFGMVFGGSIHSIVSSNVDLLHKSKPEDEAIKVPAVLHTIKSVRVNSMRTASAPGGVDVVIINGGDKEVTMGLNEVLVSKSEEVSFTEKEKPQWFGNYKVALEICNAGNRAEVERLRSIVKDLNGQIDALNGTIEANERALASYEG